MGFNVVPAGASLPGPVDRRVCWLELRLAVSMKSAAAAGSRTTKRSRVANPISQRNQPTPKAIRASGAPLPHAPRGAVALNADQSLPLARAPRSTRRISGKRRPSSPVMNTLPPVAFANGRKMSGFAANAGLHAD